MRLILYTSAVLITISILRNTLKYRPTIVPMLSKTKIYDAVVVGSGLAGLTASLELLAKGLSVALIEKTDKLGGNSAKASSGISGAPTRFQSPDEGDSVQSFYDDTIKSGKGLSNPKLVDVMTKNSADAIHWLADNFNVDLSATARLGGHSHARTHRGSGPLPPGFAIVSALSKKLQEASNVDVMKQCSFTGFQKDGSKVSGVRISCEETGESAVNGQNVILATGGFSADFTDQSSLLKRFRPDLLNFPSTNGQQTTGDGAKFAERDVNANLLHMDQVQIHPTGFVQMKDETTITSKWKFLCGELIRGIGGILLSSVNGERFVNELTTRDKAANGILTNCLISPNQPAIAIIVVGEEDYLKAKPHIGFYMSQQVMFKGTYDDVLEKLKMVVPHHSLEEATIKASLQKYNELIKNGDDLGRVHFGNAIGDEFYFGFITPVLHFSMGGIEINENGQIVTSDKKVVENAFAIGEASAGVHGGNRLGGCALLESVVFGRHVASFITK